MAYRAEEIAETIIDLSRSRGKGVTNLKLHKLLYYAQAWYLAFTDRVLFDDAIEAWVHGPVVPSVFRLFREYRWKKIDCFVTSVRDDRIKRHVNSVLDS